MYTNIGFITTDNKPVKTGLDGSMQIVYNDHTLAMEYGEIINRLYTSADISECTPESPRFRVDKALWDTGSMTSCISVRLAKKLGLKPIDTGVGVTAAGQVDIVYYLLDIHLGDDMVCRHVRVAEFPLERHDVDFLIGMDIITQGTLNISNTDGKTKLTFKLNNK